ncbi:MAG: polysaccharide biosynthesis/export family protein [Pseudomonadota bacterium]
MSARQRTSKIPQIALLASAIGLYFFVADAQAQSRYGGQVAAPHPQTVQQAPQIRNRYNMPVPQGQKPWTSARWNEILFGKKPEPKMQSPILFGQFQQWVDWEPEYTLVPGDQLDIVVGSAPELSRTLTVGPDGRVVMPMSAPIMAAGRTFTDLQMALMAELGKQLRDPRVSVTPRAYAPEQIFVGGEVGQPGTYTLNSRIGALEAIFTAGGLRPSAKSEHVAVLRRSPQGGMMMRTVNIRGGLRDIYSFNDTVQLLRGDIVFVPQNTLAEVGQFVQAFRNTLPVDFNLSYQFGAGGGNGTTVITP